MPWGCLSGVCVCLRVGGLVGCGLCVGLLGFVWVGVGAVVFVGVWVGVWVCGLVWVWARVRVRCVRVFFVLCVSVCVLGCVCVSVRRWRRVGRERECPAPESVIEPCVSRFVLFSSLLLPLKQNVSQLFQAMSRPPEKLFTYIHSYPHVIRKVIHSFLELSTGIQSYSQVRKLLFAVIHSYSKVTKTAIRSYSIAIRSFPKVTKNKQKTMEIVVF